MKKSNVEKKRDSEQEKRLSQNCQLNIKKIKNGNKSVKKRCKSQFHKRERNEKIRQS